MRVAPYSSLFPFSTSIPRRVIFTMAQPSQDDKTIIVKYPLGDSLGLMRDTLEEVEKLATSEITTNISQKAISRLLPILMGEV